MKLFYAIDALIDRITMYRLLIYCLLAILLYAALLGSFGALSYSPVAILGEAAATVAVAYVANFVFAWVYGVPRNSSSAIITGLILALLISPPTVLQDMLFPVVASGVAISAKYLLAIQHKHIFNPAAIAVVLTAFIAGDSASWWVGSTVLIPVVVISGLLITHKIRQSKMVGLFLIVAIVSTILFALLAGKSPFSTVQAVILHSSLFFLAFVMLTEPLTSPTTWRTRAWYAALVGVLFAPDLQLFGIFSTPELALVCGNLLSFIITPRVKTLIHFRNRNNYGVATQDITATPERSFTYKPGQYIELTVPHGRSDTRGIRRYLTIASSPTESLLHFGVRYYNPGSSFKRALKALDGETIATVGCLGGDFTLPSNPQRKLAFIAGGIGVTPFRSMVKYLSDTNDTRSTVMLYGERNANDIAYKEVFEEARQKVGVAITYVLGAGEETPSTKVGRIDATMVKQQIPDYADRLFYISGPHAMVQDIRRNLISLGIKRRAIKTDYFSGY